MKFRQQIKQIRPETVIDRSFVYLIFWFFAIAPFITAIPALFLNAGKFALARVSFCRSKDAGIEVGTLSHSRRMVCGECCPTLRFFID